MSKQKRNITGLKPYKKGESGNPGGRPKSAEISKAIRLILSLNDREKFVPSTWAEKIAYAQIKQAVKNRASAEYVTDRAEGKAVATHISSVDLTGAKTIIDLLTPPAEVSPEKLDV